MVKGAKKSIVIHIGPHKTGSTAIQKWLTDNSDFLAKRSVRFLHSEMTHKAGSLMSAERYGEAEQLLEQIRSEVEAHSAHSFILSQEDFSGMLPGKSKRAGIYRRLKKNVRFLSRIFGQFDTSFVFFVRDEDEWLKSCYHQNVRYRTRYSSFAMFVEDIQPPVDWAAKINEVASAISDPFHAIDYSKDVEAGIKAVLKIAKIDVDQLPAPAVRQNQSPEPDILRTFERINSRSSFPATAWFAKQLAQMKLKETDFRKDSDFEIRRQALSEIALPNLMDRLRRRNMWQDADDLLPPIDVDLSRFYERVLPEDVDLSSRSREDIRDQAQILYYHFRGKSELAWLNALVISYLRRETPHTSKAKLLFHRIWVEFGPRLVNELSTRWLISTLQTFLEHGSNESQRVIGASGFFYANMLKIYEGERSLNGLEQDETCRFLSPQTRNLFRGLDRFNVGGTDLLLNTNALALEIASRDDVAGLVLIEVLLRVKHSANVFTRFDRTREERNVEVSGFEDTWSFFVRPSNGEGP